MCDITEYGTLLAAKRFGRPVVAGGFIARFGCVRAVADAVCEGEAYDFMAAFARAKDIEDVRRAGAFNERIDYADNPIVRVTANAFYYYTGKGCPMRCKFCCLSHSREYQFAPQALVERAIRFLPPNAKLFPMCSYWPYKMAPSLTARLGALDVKVADYAAGRVTAGRQIRTGIEFASESMRKNMAKPLAPEVITEFVNRTKREKKEAACYFIAGVETQEDIESILDCFPADGALTPRIHLIFTYLDPQPFTPMHDFDIRAKVPMDGKRLFSAAQRKNRRIRVHPVKYMAHSSWRTVMQRAKTPEQVAFAWGLRNEKDNGKLLDAVGRRFPDLLGSASLSEILARPRRPWGVVPQAH
jgi:radical SAM superfamily enzyme YgiQ (UPF0313 family)